MSTSRAGLRRSAPRDAGSLPVTRRERWTVGAVTAAFVAVVAFWALFTPVFDAPDETLHVNSAARLAEGGGWPDPGEARFQAMVADARGEAAWPAAERATFAELRAEDPGDVGLDQMTQHPPTYYLYVSVFLRAVDFVDLRVDVALLIARLSGLLFAAPLPLLVWDSVRRVTRSRRAGIVGAASLLAVPQLAHILGSVSNDVMMIAFGSAVVWLTVRLMTGDARRRVVVGLGVALALALLTKSTALPLVPFAGLALLLWPSALPLARRIRRTALAAVIALAGGWWWVRNLVVHGTLQPAGIVYEPTPWADGTGPDPLFFAEQLWQRVSSSFWGKFGWLDYPIPTFLSDILTVVCLAVVIGFAIRRGPLRWQTVVLAALPVVTFAAMLTQTWPSYVRTQLPAGMQGRYFFVIIVPLIVLSAVAWRRLVAPAYRRRAGVAIVLASAAMAVVGYTTEFALAYGGDARRTLDLLPGSDAANIAAVVLTALVGLTAVVAAVLFVGRGSSVPVLAHDADHREAHV
ncbi:DUF2142 domain-containing protein [Microbacterium betulae]|uniref:DUF2142 domain-containing protein n=1 Tax=Microbacterium betulae TaxID=2981139 RepID=A0AA97FIG4_9MICO|nr:DUF2142 domain-containing protein [Microbacterium sp. AB]WOF24171.1 DUF2142 domain-containing protein [Microbacterium sp. AB]